MRLLLAIPALLIGVRASRLCAQQVPDSAARARVEWFIDAAPSQWFGTTRDYLMAIFGPPSRTWASPPSPNPYDTLTADTLITLQYDSATFVYYVVPSTQRELLIEFTLTGSRYTRRLPIRIGAGIREVRRFFGDTATGMVPSASYFCSWCLIGFEPPPTVTFWFDERGSVRGIKWETHVD